MGRLKVDNNDNFQIAIQQVKWKMAIYMRLEITRLTASTSD